MKPAAKITMTFIILLTALLLTACPGTDSTPTEGVCTVKGKVTFNDGSEVGSALVSINFGNDPATLTDVDGNFTLEVEMSSYDSNRENAEIEAYYSVPENCSKTISLEKNKTITENLTITKLENTHFNGVPVEGYIEEEDEVDWYKFSAYTGQIVKIDLYQDICPVDPLVNLYQAGDGSSLDSMDDRDGTNEPTDLSTGNIQLPADGDYFVSISDRYGDDTSSGVPYRLTITVVNNPDTGEPANDEKLNGTALSNGIPVSGYIATEDDYDWYKINAYAGQIMQIQLTMPVNSDGVDPWVVLESQYDTSNIWDEYNSNGAYRPTELISPNILIEEDDIYCIAIHDDDKDEFSTTVPYTLTVTISENPDTGEPANDIKSNAEAISSGIPVSGYIGTDNDYDWYKINAYEGQIMQIELTMPINSDGVDTWVVLESQYDTSNIWSDYDSNGENGPTEIISPNILIEEDDVYCISIHDDDNNEFSTTVPYTLTVTVINNPDTNEPENNEKVNAIPISNGSPVSGYVGTDNDIDWYKINAYTGDTLKIQLSMPMNSDGVDPRIVLESQYDTSNIWSDYDSNGETGPTEIISPDISIDNDGVYCICVYDDDNNEFSTTVAYTLTVTVE